MTVARNKRKSVVLLIATVVALLLMQSHAEAACSSPGGNPGDVFFSSVQNVMVYCNGTSWIAMGLNQVVNFGTLTTGDFCTATGGTAISCTTATIGLSSLSQIAGLSVLGNASNTTGNVAAITGAANQVLVVNNAGTALAFGAVNLGSSAAITGNLPVANGGTDTGSQTTNGVNYFNGTSITSGTGFVYSGSGVGIGSTSPQQALDVSGYVRTSSANSTGLMTYNSTTGVTYNIYNASATANGFSGLGIYDGTAYRLVISSGNVGIGTTSPSGLLHIYKSADDQPIIESGSGINYLDLLSHNGGGNYGSDIEFHDGSTDSADISSIASGGLWFSVGGGSAALAINSSGSVGIGTTNPNYLLEVAGKAAIDGGGTVNNDNTALRVGHASGTDGITIQASNDTDHAVIFYSAGGSNVGTITENGSNTSYNTSSDRRLKENISPTSNGLAMLSQIPVDDFNFISDPTKTRVQGFIAQDLYRVYPEAVTVGGDNPKTTPWSVDYGRLTPLIVKAVQELKADNDDLRAANDNEAAQIKALTARIDALEAKTSHEGR